MQDQHADTGGTDVVHFRHVHGDAVAPAADTVGQRAADVVAPDGVHAAFKDEFGDVGTLIGNDFHDGSTVG